MEAQYRVPAWRALCPSFSCLAEPPLNALNLQRQRRRLFFGLPPPLLHGCHYLSRTSMARWNLATEANRPRRSSKTLPLCLRISPGVPFPSLIISFFF